jgi:hypothetical protein
MKFFDRGRRTSMAVFLGLLFIAAGFVNAQSGRRSPVTVNTPAPATTPAPAPSPVIERTVVKPEIKVKVVGDVPLAVNLPFAAPDALRRWVLERLRTSDSIAIEGSESGTLDKAERIAKAATDVHVVFVQLEENPVADSQPDRTKMQRGELWVNFYVLMPGTGKINQRGRVYLAPPVGGIRKVLDGRACGDAALSDEEQMVREAAREAAERAMSILNVPVPDFKCPGQPFTAGRVIDRN